MFHECDFTKKVLQKREEKYKENKVNFEGAYLRNGLVDLAQIWNWRCLTPREVTQKFLYVFVQGVLSYRCMKTVFTPVKYTRDPGFLGRPIYYCAT